VSNATSFICPGISKKYINDACEDGIKVFTGSIPDPSDPDGRRVICIYHYEWSDSSWSPDYQQVGETSCDNVSIGPGGL